jgi:hypothetical protein
VLCLFLQISLADIFRKSYLRGQKSIVTFAWCSAQPQVCLPEALQADCGGVLKIWVDLRDDNTGGAGVVNGGGADIAQLLISRQGKFFPEEFLMAVDLQHLQAEFAVNYPGLRMLTLRLKCESAMRHL